MAFESSPILSSIDNMEIKNRSCLESFTLWTSVTVCFVYWSGAANWALTM